MKIQELVSKKLTEKKAKKSSKKKDPCWKGYEQIGMKKLKGREVPNCVPKKKA